MQLPSLRRQRLLLALVGLEKERNRRYLTEIELQKLLFLFGTEAERQDYSFVPFKQGCYSFTADRDLKVMVERNLLSLNRKRVRLGERVRLDGILGNSEFKYLEEWLGRNTARGDALIAETYKMHPYFATKSERLDDLKQMNLLSQNTLRKIREAKHGMVSDKKIIFTIGYEGIDVETYIAKLIDHDVKVLCDVRKNPISRKFGFSKGFLMKTLPEFGIEYKHYPDLGIESKFRRELFTADDYSELFKIYRKSLTTSSPSILEIQDLVMSRPRIAITCFEAKPEFCHRHCVADFLKEHSARKKLQIRSI